MKTCEEIRMDWKEIRPKLGNLTNAMDAKIDETGDYEAAQSSGFQNGYKEGLDEAWAAAQRIMLNVKNIDAGEREQIFGFRFTHDVLRNLSATEAVQKLKEYDELEEAKAARQKIIIEDLKEMYRKYGPDEVFEAQKKIDLAGR